MHQWYNLMVAFGVAECAIINTSDEAIPYMTSEFSTTVYDTLEEFLADHSVENLTYVEISGDAYNQFDYSATDWLVLGGSDGLPHAHVGIDTGLIGLYSREAAAIVLAASKWQ